MNKFWIIFKREYAQVVKKKSFLVGIFLTPILMIGFVLLPAWLTRVKSSESEPFAIVDQSKYDIGNKLVEALNKYKLNETVEEMIQEVAQIDGKTKDTIIASTDSNQAASEPYYLIKGLFVIDPSDQIKFDQTVDSLRQQIIDKELKYFMVIKSNSLDDDENIYLVTNSDNFTSLRRFERNISRILSTIRLEESEINLDVDSVLSLTRRIDLVVQDAKGESIPFEIKYFSAIAFVGIMFGMIVGYGQLVMRSVIEEKNSRVMEVLISSVSPFELMLGKIMGLGAATFTQVAIWFSIGGIMFLQKSALDINPSIDRIIFNAPIVIFFILFLTFGYIMFSTIFALVGSIVNTEKEAQSFVMPITMTMVLPFMVGIYVVQDPNSTMAVTMSMIPLLAPTMMMMRLVFVAPSVSEYSIFSGIVGEATLALIIVILFTIFLIWLTSKIFRVGILMYGKRPTLGEIIKWVKS